MTLADPRDASVDGRRVARIPRSMDRPCGWCRGPLEATRRDVRYCSKRCRQAGHRASIGRVAIAGAARPMRLAYADPPYPGLSARYYREHPDFAGEVDHAALLSRLATYDGWALSTSARALPEVLALCVAQDLRVRVAAWIRGARPHATARLLNAWEPVVFAGGRSVASGSRTIDPRQISDVLLGVTPRRRPTLPGAVVGMKPPLFAAWVFDLLGACRGDELDDLYPGSGIVARTWLVYNGREPSGVAAAGSYASLLERGPDSSSGPGRRVAVAPPDV